MYQNFIKPLLDFLTALVVLLVTSPVLVLVCFALMFVNKGNIWFFQERPGLNEKIFKVVKFKTMTDAKDGAGNFLPDNERLTRIGNFIRKTSIDELPQLINVLKGEMSFTGPRPLLKEYLPLYDNQQKKRHNVKPGITGWAQVKGRNTLSWPEKFAYDVWYVENQSFWLDIKILFLTIIKVIKSEGINSSTSATMEKFRGNK